MTIDRIDVGRLVLCDLCNADWTDRKESGGFLFVSKGVCPTCAPGFEAEVKSCGEEEFIRGRCIPGMSFADWVRELRGGDNSIVIRSGEDAL